MTKPPRKPRSIGLKKESDEPRLKSGRVRRADFDKPELLLDPMPARVEPCLAELTAKPPKGDRWVYEIKWDGYRAHIHREPNGVRILTKNGHDWTHKFPAVAEAALALTNTTYIMDGEIVVLDDQGRSDFNLLVSSLGGRAGNRAAANAIFMAFDLFYQNGRDLRRMEYSSRRHILEQALKRSTGAIKLSEEFAVDPDILFRHAYELELEGIIAKRTDARHMPGRTGTWRKIKCKQSDTFQIVGYEPSGTPGLLASILVAQEHSGKLRYAGSVGTGFNVRDVRELKSQLDALRVDKPAIPIKTSRKNLVYTKPTLYAEIQYRGWTVDKKLRHPSYNGLRSPEEL
ncbi:ATP-dependent DNA ligase [Rhizobium bangladeshense]|uniref:non-homologous end-joining DNA ligase n=1 Tax=Rhizobium bangladeshense TaxID=1138189 RepID=UPI001C82D5E7|nr:non-homologous end-joining DNA ligase [Rhizobium bangladeshense]MBX4920002.1 ATP-dependent DNA ligase [Rhizobium bangladeshense]